MSLKNDIFKLKDKIFKIKIFKVYNKQSLFRKYMSVSLVIVFFSFLVLGTILTVVITNYWTNQKITALENRADNIADYLVEKILSNSPMDSNATFYIENEDMDGIQHTLELFAKDSDMDIYILKTNGTSFIVQSNERGVMESGISAPEIARETLMARNYSQMGDLDGVYKSNRFIVARPLRYQQDRIEGDIGVIIVTTDGKDITSFTDMVLRIFILSAVASLALSVLAISVFSYNMVKPLKQMAKAAKQFGKGDFSVRVSETTNDEIGELAVAFNNMAESLASSETTRKSFVANVSHELKTPMTTIAGFIDGILDGTIPPQKHSYYLHIVSDEVKRLSRLVHSMLNLSRIDNGELKINYKSFDLLTTLVTIVITYEREIDKRNIEVRGLDQISPKTVYGDKDLIHQVVYNLIENAVKFTDEGGYIEFDITEDAEKTVFSVKNSGQGIKKEELPLIFDRFYKTDKSRSKDKKGLGLGLYLVRSIIRQHGGEIKAESVYGEYTRFEFYLPKKQEKNT